MWRMIFNSTHNLFSLISRKYASQESISLSSTFKLKLILSGYSYLNKIWGREPLVGRERECQVYAAMSVASAGRYRADYARFERPDSHPDSHPGRCLPDTLQPYWLKISCTLILPSIGD